MDMHHVGEFAERGAFAHQDADLLNNVGRMGAIGMATEDKASSAATKSFSMPSVSPIARALPLARQKDFLHS